ncbi:hypothetical protein K8Z61_06165 [Nocardioides sp. TRM66260-LWL]|uniref:hypothetical protein n=1 Tax=Nocardioides sp. TRM66260-LWL TaxID=2874478 RepID=UPI001CC45B75|nr:hypothetical protein [Nocardioides sp. TRM66260-LWL]MBZ5734076.1 hypothetical protein [Nocardioides sp. TRM66260-LWL]
MSSLPLIDIAIEVFELLVAHPIQRCRARRLLRGMAPCVLAYPSSGRVMPGQRWAGVATFERGRIRAAGWQIDVLSVDRAGAHRVQPGADDSRMVFSPRERVYTVATTSGTVELTLIERYADRTLDLL